MMTTAELDLLARERHYDLRAEAARDARGAQGARGPRHLSARARRAVAGAAGAVLLVGVLVFGDAFGLAKAAGLDTAVLALVLLTV